MQTKATKYRIHRKSSLSLNTNLEIKNIQCADIISLMYPSNDHRQSTTNKMELVYKDLQKIMAENFISDVTNEVCTDQKENKK